MFGNMCLMEVMVAERLAAARAEAARERLFQAVRTPRQSLWVLIGGWLLRLRERLRDLPAAGAAQAAPVDRG